MHIAGMKYNYQNYIHMYVCIVTNTLPNIHNLAAHNAGFIIRICTYSL